MKGGVDLKEEKFIKELKKKDSKAFEKLYSDYAAMVFGILRNFVRPSEIEDAIQEVFLRVFRGIDKFRGSSKLSTWIYRIAVNVGKDYVKKYSEDKVQTVDLQNDGNEKYLKSFVSSESQDDALQGVNYSSIIKTMEKLSPGDRLIIQMRDLDRLSYKEISTILEIPLGSVKSRLYYARKRLGKLIEQEKII
jgi:RNA polymerase sigma-70 factor (ECF subfamily)